MTAVVIYAMLIAVVLIIIGVDIWVSVGVSQSLFISGTLILVTVNYSTGIGVIYLPFGLELFIENVCMYVKDGQCLYFPWKRSIFIFPLINNYITTPRSVHHHYIEFKNFVFHILIPFFFSFNYFIISSYYIQSLCGSMTSQTCEFGCYYSVNSIGASMCIIDATYIDIRPTRKTSMYYLQ